MPFTLSHAAAALPLRALLRGAAVFPALVIGCFIPDVPYFLPYPLYDINAHQLPDLILFGIPCGWALYTLWYAIFLQPIRALLPERYALLVVPLPAKRWFAKPWATTLSLMAGAASHIVWDAFTHRRGFAVHAWPALAQPVMHIGPHALPSYFIFQYLSTLLGIVWLGLYVRRSLHEFDREAPATAAKSPPELSPTARLIVIAVLMILAAGLVLSSFSSSNPMPLRFSAYNFVCRSVSSTAIVVAFYAIVWHASNRLLLSRRRHNQSIAKPRRN
jgi:hypothetical protein